MTIELRLTIIFLYLAVLVGAVLLKLMCHIDSLEDRINDLEWKEELLRQWLEQIQSLKETKNGN
jgi:hypothetical protein